MFEFIGKIREKKKLGREYNKSREKLVESWGGKGQWSRSRGRGNGGRDRCSSLLLVGAGVVTKRKRSDEEFGEKQGILTPVIGGQ